MVARNLADRGAKWVILWGGEGRDSPIAGDPRAIVGYPNPMELIFEIRDAEEGSF